MFRSIRKFVFVLLLVASGVGIAANCHDTRVVYVTFDGIAINEMNSSNFPKVFSRVLPYSDYLGAIGAKRVMRVASIPTSYPSYLSQMTGKVGPCQFNWCKRVDTETFPEEIKRRLQLESADVAVIASWPRIADAAEHIPGNLFTDAGNGKKTRDDEETFVLAREYLDKVQPTFLWIAFDNADHYGHMNDRASFERTIHHYDSYVQELLDTANNNQCLDNTWFVFTTDHGRGLGPAWIFHGPAQPFSKFTWLMIVRASDQMNHKHTPIPFNLTHSNYDTTHIKPLVKSFYHLV